MCHHHKQVITSGNKPIAIGIAENFRDTTKHHTPKQPASRNAI
jgi:hypothetical protein